MCFYILFKCNKSTVPPILYMYRGNMFSRFFFESFVTYTFYVHTVGYRNNYALSSCYDSMAVYYVTRVRNNNMTTTSE